jgi:hypothetical protein
MQGSARIIPQLPQNTHKIKSPPAAYGETVSGQKETTSVNSYGTNL